jgi:hypothetical protein
MFHGRVGRQYWEGARDLRLSTSANRMERRFHEILEEEYQRAQPIQSEPHWSVATHKQDVTQADKRAMFLIIGAVAAIAGYRAFLARRSATKGRSQG